MSFKCERYNEFLDRVIEWNRVASGPVNRNSNNQDRVYLQKQITREEIDETVKAIKEDDKKEILDGVADVFVTAGYLNYLKTGNVDVPVHTQDGNFDPLIILRDIDTDRLFHSGGPQHQNIQRLYSWACKTYGQDEVDEYFERVLISNESKFVPLDQWSENEIVVATEKYREKGFSDIVGVDATFKDVPVKVLRADNGNGKILKPTIFQEP